MNHLLTGEDKKAAKREYRLRLIAVGLLLFFAALVIGAVSLLPSLFLTRSKKSSLDAEEAAIAAGNGAAEEKSLTDEVALSRKKLAMLAPDLSDKTVFAALHAVLAAKPSDISVTGFYFAHSDPTHISLTGVAAKRESLVEYQKQLVASGLFTNVDTPLSDFAGNSNIGFTITLTGTF